MTPKLRVLPPLPKAPTSDVALREHAMQLYPHSLEMQAKWVRAVKILRETKEGWCLERELDKS